MIGAREVKSADLDSLAVTSGKLAVSAVTKEKLAAAAVTAAKIDTSAVTTEKLKNGAVDSEKLQASAVTTEKIADGTILFSDIDENGAAPGQVMKWTGASWAAQDDSIGVSVGSAGWVDDGGVVRLTDLYDNVGIGTDTPSYKLDVDGDIHASGTIVSGSSVVIDGDSESIYALGGVLSFIDNDIVTTGKATIGSSHTNTGSGSFVAGDSNVATEELAFAVGGANQALGAGASVAGGMSNIAGGDFSVVGGGEGNEAQGQHAVVGGGGGGGMGNRANGHSAAVSGGSHNSAEGMHSWIGGGESNTAEASRSAVCGGVGNVAAGEGAFVGGGSENRARGQFSVVAGGGGVGAPADSNAALGDYCTIGGGLGNRAGTFWELTTSATVGGGARNEAGGEASTIAGGRDNRAEGEAATVGGGDQNLAEGTHATVPGGVENLAQGEASFAAGMRAEAMHPGTFVWSDQSAEPPENFQSTDANQFLIRAAGGVGIGTNAPGAALDVEGSVRMQGFELPTGATNGHVLTTDGLGNGSWQPAGPADGDWYISGDDMWAGVPGNVGIGTTSPLEKLDVVGDARIAGNMQVQEFEMPEDTVEGYVLTTDDHGHGTWQEGGLVLPFEGSSGGGGSENVAFRVTHTAVTTGTGIEGRGGIIGVKGRVFWGSGYGVFGSSDGGYGVSGVASGGGAVGVYGQGASGGSAGLFSGNVVVTGTLSKGGGSFKIDHPLDPENKYLLHSFVESPDMMNVYNGNVVLDAAGGAWVELAEWFESLNRDFRYQLTAVGAPGPNLHIAEKIAGNRFRIGGGEPGMEVSWQVTGVRQDAFAEANRIPVEVDKTGDDRGRYLHPEAHGVPETAGIDYEGKQERLRLSFGEE